MAWMTTTKATDLCMVTATMNRQQLLEFIADLDAQRCRLATERDALLAACRAVEGAFNVGGIPSMPGDIYNQLRAAIRAAEGERRSL